MWSFCLKKDLSLQKKLKLESAHPGWEAAKEGAAISPSDHPHAGV